MNKTLILLLVLLLLGGVAYWLSQGDDVKMEALSYERDFGVKDINEIGLIKLKYKDGHSVVIERKEKAWYVDDSLKVWKPVIDVFLRTLKNIEVDYTPPKAAVPVAEKDFKDFGIDVKIYDRDGDVLQDYLIGGVTPDEKGTFAIKPNSSQPFVMRIPFADVSLRGRFEVNPEEWRDRFIFQEQWEDIQRVTVEYPRARKSSFIIEKSDGKYSVMPFGELGSPEKKLIAPGRAEAYLMHFEKIGCEAFENTHPKRDSVSNLIPFCNLTLEKDDGEVKWIKLYPINSETGDVDMSQKFLSSPKRFRYLGDMSGGDFIFIQHQTIGNVLQPYQSF